MLNEAIPLKKRNFVKQPNNYHKFNFECGHFILGDSLVLWRWPKSSEDRLVHQDILHSGICDTDGNILDLPSHLSLCQWAQQQNAEADRHFKGDLQEKEDQQHLHDDRANHDDCNRSLGLHPDRSFSFFVWLECSWSCFGCFVRHQNDSKRLHIGPSRLLILWFESWTVQIFSLKRMVRWKNIISLAIISTCR